MTEYQRTHPVPKESEVPFRSPYEHYRAAEFYLNEARLRQASIPEAMRQASTLDPLDFQETLDTLVNGVKLDLQYAQVHATLATVQRSIV